MTRQTRAAILAALLPLAAGCGGLGLGTLERLLPPGTFGSGSSSPFVGQWTQTSIIVDGQTGVCPGNLNIAGTNYSCEAIVRAFVADGTFNDSSPVDQKGSGTWAVSGSTLTITKNGVVQTGTVGFPADLSSFQFVAGTTTYVWTKS